jgi:hypothetical protein
MRSSKRASGAVSLVTTTSIINTRKQYSNWWMIFQGRFIYGIRKKLDGGTYWWLHDFDATGQHRISNGRDKLN